MNDETKKALTWIREQLGHDTRQVARDLLAHIDGETARQAAAVAAAREEQREACARYYAGAQHSNREVECTIRATPLTAKPLGDRIAELEQQKDDLKTMIQDLRRRAESAEALRDEAVAALRAQGVDRPNHPDGPGWCIGRCPIRTHDADCEQARAVLAKYPEGK